MYESHPLEQLRCFDSKAWWSSHGTCRFAPERTNYSGTAKNFHAKSSNNGRNE